MIYDEAAISAIKEYFTSGNLSLSVAESVTGGHLQAAISSADEASGFYQGGITAYNLGQKSRHLLVDPIKAEMENCVSKSVALQMACGATKLFNSDVAIAITGYASPLPEKDVYKIFAWVAIVDKNEFQHSFKITSNENEPINVQIDYVNQVLKRFISVLR